MKNKIVYGLMLFFLLFIPRVNACELTYDEYNEKGIQQAFIVGDYVFNTDDSYSPSLEDFATAARTIPEDEDVYIYHVLNLDMETSVYVKVTEIFSEMSNIGKQFFPKVDVSYEYWNTINGASDSDYERYFCKVGKESIGINYTTLETLGENDYKISASRTVKIDSANEITNASYCVTSANECTPDTTAKLSSNKTFKVNYETGVAGQRICTKATDVYGNYTDVICDDTLVYVDSVSAVVTPTETLGTTIEKTPSPIDGLFEIDYPISGGEVIYYYYAEKNGVETKFLLTDMSDLPEGDIKVEAKVVAGNGLVTTASRVIKVKRHTVTYDYETNGGTSSQIETYTTAYKGKAKLTPTAYRQNYEFLGWNTDPNAKDGIDSLVVEGDVTLYAIFKGELTAEFEIANKDDSIPATIEYNKVSCVVYNNESSCDVKIPVLYPKVGYDALGWGTTKYAKETIYTGGETITLTDNNLKLYSVTRDKNAKTVTFNSYRDEKVVQDVLKCYPYNGETSCTVDASGITSDPYKGRTFKGYTEDKENPTPGTVSELTSGREFYAYYEDVYEINYVTGEGVKTKDETGVLFIIDSSGVEEYVTSTTVKEPESMDGWIFVGYRTDKEYGTAEIQPGQEISPNKDITYYAIYQRPIEITYAIDYEVIKKPKNHVGKKYYLSSTQAEIGYKYKLAAVDEIERDQYVFRGWLISGTEYDAGTEITITNDTEITPTWSLDGCYIFFDYKTNGGQSATKSSLTYINGDPAIDLKKITAYKSGWTFIGWTDKEGANSSPLTSYKPANADEDITLYAMFEKNIIIDYRVQDAENFTIGSQERVTYTIYNKEEFAEVPMPVIKSNSEEHEPVGWNTESDSTEALYESGKTVEISDGYTVLYTITKSSTQLTGTFHYVDETGNKTTTETKCFLYNASKSCELTPPDLEVVFDRHVLTGWGTNKQVIDENVSYVINRNTDFYGYYDKILKITYHSGIMQASTDIQTVSLQNIVHTDGITTITPTAILGTPDGIADYATLGWRKDTNADVQEYVTNDKLTIEQDIDLYGVYNKNITLSYATNRGDSQPASETKTMFYNTVQDTDKITEKFVLADAITKTGYTFNGWLAENQTIANQPGDTVELNKSTKYTAQWQVNQYKVNYNFTENGGTRASQNTAMVDFDTDIDLSVTAFKEGYEFVGWATEPNSSTIASYVTMPAEEITVYAVFRKEVKGTWIVTDPTAGSVANETTSCYKYNNGDSCELNTGEFIPAAGMEIVGWTTQQGSGEMEVSASAKVLATDDVTYYSITRGATGYKGTFYYATEVVDMETGEPTGEMEFTSTTEMCEMYNGEKSCTISAPSQPIDYKGAVFVGWTFKVDEVTEVDYVLTEDREYYAHYESVVGVNLYEGEAVIQEEADSEGEEEPGQGTEGDGTDTENGDGTGTEGEGTDTETGDGTETEGEGNEGGDTGSEEEESPIVDEGPTYVVSEMLTGGVEYTIDGNGDNKVEPKIVLRKPAIYKDFEPLGWSTDKETLQSTPDYIGDEELDVNETLELYALYERTLKVTYDTQSDINIDAIEIKQNYHTILGPTVHTTPVSGVIKQEGAVLASWAKDSITGEKISPLSNLVVDDHTTLYAVWDGNDYKINYVLNNSYVSKQLKTDVEYLEIIELVNPTKTVNITGQVNNTGATITGNVNKQINFVGWKLAGNFNTAQYALTQNNFQKWENDTVKPKALWVKNLQLDEGSTATLTAEFEEPTVKLPKVTKTGKTCKWNTQADGKGTTYNSEADYKIPMNSATEIKLYAICS